MEKLPTLYLGINRTVIQCLGDDIIIRYFYPSPDLCCIVKYYWMVQVKDMNKFNKLSIISPSGYPELIFHFGDNICVSTSGGGSSKTSVNSFIAGQITHPVHLHFKNYINCLCIKLQPYALKALFKIKCSEFTNRATSLNEIHPNMQKDIYEQLSEANNNNVRIRIIEDYLRKLLKKHYNSTNLVIWEVVNYQKVNINNNDLEQLIHMSTRKIQRRFLEDVGLSPKQLRRIFRFNQAYHLLKHNTNLDLQDVSFQLGYYDLSHMINEFKEFTGSAPVRYFKSEDPFNSLFAGIL
ncbi:MAG: helix-turn-helix domain-containing protein [Bacteroidales bacterium]|nr:helix-turn-helix domain-containing protein [Bacteroidales bacterium]